MIRKTVIDTNILISALLTSHEDAATVQILKMLLNGHIIPVISEKIIQEYEDVLKRKKFGFPEDSVNALLEEISRR